MRRILFGILISASFSSFGQSVSPDVIATAGNDYQNGTMQISWTLGEPLTETLSGGQNQITQGFHQTNLSWVSTYALNDNVVFSVFPNPVVNQLSIEVSMIELGSTLQVIDAKGRVLMSEELNDLTATIDFSAYSAGTYQLSLLNKDKGTIKTFTIQKLN